MSDQLSAARPTCGDIEALVLGRDDWGSRSTQQGYEALVSQLKGYANGGYSSRDVDADFCRGFAQYLLANVKPSSARGYLEKLRTLMRQLKRQGSISEVTMPPISELLPPSGDAEKVFLTKDELRRMQDADCPAATIKQAFLFSCYTGLLKGEVKDLQWDDIRLNGAGLVVNRPVEGGAEKVKVPLVEPAREILHCVEREYVSLPPEQRDDRVFHLPSNTTISTHLTTWAHQAGIAKNINYMTSRHTFATMALRAGVDLYVVAKWCGYSSVVAAQPYADLVGLGSRSADEVLEAAFA